MLVWRVEGAESVHITGCPGGCPSDLNPKSGFKSVPIPLNEESVTFTLIAKKRNKEAKMTKVVQLNQSHTSLSLSPRTNSFTTEDSVTIKGRVSKPPDKYGQASIYVEGQPVGTAVINNKGEFVWQVPLQNKTKKEHLRLVLPEKTITDCSKVKTIAYLSNVANMDEISNMIKVVTDIAGDKESTSIVVRQLARVTRIKLSTRKGDDDCLCQNFEEIVHSDNTIIPEASNKAIEIPVIETSTGFRMDDNCICLQTMEIETTAGKLKTSGKYIININRDCR